MDTIGAPEECQTGLGTIGDIGNWWWVRVLPPPGTLIWRLPGFIRPRCTSGATHRFAESYYGLKFHWRFDVIGGMQVCQRVVSTVTGFMFGAIWPGFLAPARNDSALEFGIRSRGGCEDIVV